MGRGGFKELKVWQRGKNLAVEVYRITATGPFKYDFSLRDQMRRAAVSIPSNIAEGDERDTDKEAIRYFFIAKGSAAELNTQLIIASEVGYIPREIFKNLETECEEIAGMLARLITARSKKRVI